MGIRLKLALALLVIVGGSLATAYAIVVPQLENRLVTAKLSSMERDAVGVAVSLPVDPFSWDLYAENASVSCGALTHGWWRSRLATDAATNSSASASVTARR